MPAPGRILCAATLILLALSSAFESTGAGAADPAQFGLASASASLSTVQAGAHPDLQFTFAIKQDPASQPNPAGFKEPFAPAKDLRFGLPPGLIGDPGALGSSDLCRSIELVSWKEKGGGCPNGSQVGTLSVRGYGLDHAYVEPVYAMDQSESHTVARLGTVAGVYPVFINVTRPTKGDGGLLLSIENASPVGNLIEANLTTWGVPSNPSHDTERCTPREAALGCLVSPPRPPGSRPFPFLTNPTRCGVQLDVDVAVSSWFDPERFDELGVPLATISGCGNLAFGPSLTLRPTTRQTSAPTGLELSFSAPGPGGNGLESSQSRAVRIQLPPGFAVNPGFVDGLRACTAEQVHIGEELASQCPDAAKLGPVEIELGNPPRLLQGAIYLREPAPADLFRFWLLVDDLDARVKMPGLLEVDRATGQITSVLLETPQVPLRGVRLSLKSGARAPLISPPACGDHLAHYEISSWSDFPPALGTSAMPIDEGCDEGGFSPTLAAGTLHAMAGAGSPLVLTIARKDSEQDLSGINIALPPGLAADLAAATRCEGAGLVTGECPPSSRIGSIAVSLGAGSRPLFLPQPDADPTAIFLGGPYRGHPFSLILVLPAQAGPFDLGTVVLRAAIEIDSTNGRATVSLEDLPQIRAGIPLHYREIRLVLDRPGFIRNPTSCEPTQITGTATAVDGAGAELASRFQAVDCAALAFRPTVAFHLSGGLGRNAHPQIDVDLIPHPAEANLAAATLTLPAGELLDTHRIRALCARPLAPDQCPRDSRLGYARIRSPLLPEALEGPIYLRAPSHRLPDLLAELGGGGIHVLLHGRTATAPGGRLRVRFSDLPDLPLARASITLAGGRSGIFANSEALCARPRRATVSLSAHNGKQRRLRPTVSFRGRC